MFDTDDIKQVLSNAGLQSLGVANPSISVKWTTNTNASLDPTEGPPGSLSLTSGDHWVAPLGGILLKTNGTDRILQPSGDPIPTTSLVFRVHPFIYLRLKRFYATIIEGQTADTDQPERPVPYYFVYITSDDLSAVGVLFGAGDDLGFSGSLTIHDEHGFPIDPVAVAGALEQIVNTHNVLEDKDFLSTSGTTQANRQIYNIGQMGSTQTIVHLIDLFGKPYSGSDVQNVVALSNGLHTVTTAATALDFSSSATAKETLRIGPATNGTLGTSYTIRTKASAITLHRDFVRAYVTNLKPHLTGTVDPGDAAVSSEERPAIRHDETINFHYNGNAALGGANTIINGAPDDVFVVSPVIKGDFNIPTDGTAANAQWPNFPAGTPLTSGKIAVSLKDNFNPTAHFVDGSDENTDVVVTISGFTAGQAVRVYNRVFLPDAREGRGGGAGSVARVPSGSTDAKVSLVLKDPLGLKAWGTPVTLPTDPTLHIDLVVVNGDGTVRVFGNVTANIGIPAALSTEETELTGTETNGFDTAEFRSISSAGILGLTPITTSLSGGSTVDKIRSLLSEGNPRDSARLPTMARRDTMIASRSSSTFKGQISGMHLTGASRSALHRKGSPGGKGGGEFHVVAAQLDGGRLGYDINRAAYRRAKNLIERLYDLKNNDWNEPAAATGGTFSGALLQTIASGVETPELGAFTSTISSVLSGSWSDAVDWMKTQINVNTLPDALFDSLKSSANATRLFDEFKREFSACAYGRRDAYWSLKNAFENAREFVYFEGPAFSRTAYGLDLSSDLLNILKTRMTAHSGLRVIAALSKKLDYGPGYDTFAAREYVKRKEAVDFLDALSTVNKKRVVAFHPIGFPGRALELMTNVVIVDDVFALIGTSTIRRKGLTFDGGEDLVFFDRTIKHGKSSAIRDFRRNLMAAHLNAYPPVGTNMPDPDWIRLADGNQAFEVFRELLESEGAGLIEKIWDGKIPGKPAIDPSSFPIDNVADPDGRNFDALVGILVSALTAAAIPPAWP